MWKLLFSTLVVLVFLQTTTALPTMLNSEVHLTTLGIPTAEELAYWSSINSRSPLERRWTDTCSAPSTAYLVQVQPCLDAILNAGSKGELCGTTASSTVLCSDNTAEIVMMNLVAPAMTASTCNDVAKGVQWIIDNCKTNNGQQVAGQAAANGNGNLILEVTSST